MKKHKSFFDSQNLVLGGLIDECRDTDSDSDTLFIPFQANSYPIYFEMHVPSDEEMKTKN